MPSYQPHDKLRVRVSGPAKAVRAFLQAHPPGCERLEALEDGDLAIEATIEAAIQRELEAAKLKVEVLYVIADRMREVARDMGVDNRFGGGRRLRGLGVRGKETAT